MKKVTVLMLIVLLALSALSVPALAASAASPAAPVFASALYQPLVRANSAATVMRINE